MNNTKIIDYLKENMINLDLKAKTKNDVIKELMKSINNG